MKSGVGIGMGDALWDAAVETIEKYDESARVIYLHLREFCDDSTPRDVMISNASRKSAAMIKTLETKLAEAEKWMKDEAMAEKQMKEIFGICPHCNGTGRIE